MLKILSGKQVSLLDSAFIQSQGISSWELMDQAAYAFTDWFMSQNFCRESKIYIFAGKGNNGGDGVAIARLLSVIGFSVVLVNMYPLEECSPDNQKNLKRLPAGIQCFHIHEFDWQIAASSIIIDALLGVGLSQPLSGILASTVQRINELSCKRIAIDIPSGLPADGPLNGDAIEADITVTFQFPKLSLLFPEHAAYTGKMVIVDIGIPTSFLQSFEGNHYLLQREDVYPLHLKKSDFIHKGDMGKVMLIGGSKGKVGAVLLASQAALRTGSGLVYTNIPAEERLICQVAFPEIMYTTDLLDDLDAVGVGPGWGTTLHPEEIAHLFEKYDFPLVLDADAINLIAKYPKLLKKIPSNSIFTPHLKEFERLVGPCENHLVRLEKAKDFAIRNHVIVVLKGAFTCISSPQGEQFFNTSGNKYMATAGSGDVLTGVITSFLGQGYSPIHAALVGVYHHGLAGDIAARTKNRGLIASDIIRAIPQSFIEMGIE
ncbi:NAD(P)H-hydrate dehydratase [Mongoliitalea daihaiensis]|uniref:NAD(P)H-hydrate dehydratase n=1 Tax=Mongoliitalea daihaiensis TaxID=2782006 RepID=UPI001F2337AC|nr:NAD(P)H-hydrate dehydratase [Mongoliitalea daihaiensis]UJP65154.1 NAD(P)H-hydrate dehydratase [Mongoliitalea daihaiensis]